MKNNEVYIENAPNLEGLSFRKFAGESDYPEQTQLCTSNQF